MDKIYNQLRGPFANCLVLHDFANKNPDIKAWFEFTISFFRGYGLKPNRLSPLKSKGKTVSFDRGIKAFYKADFKNLEGMSFSHRVHEDAYDDDAYFDVWLSLNSLVKNHTLVVGFDNNILGLEHNVINGLAKDMASYFTAQYGYVYQLPYEKGPMFNPFGILYGRNWSIEEERLIDLWGKRYQKNYKTGDLRDIYLMNLLSTAHQNNTVNGVPFFDWIKKNPKHGALTELNEHLWAWWVESDEIPTVREELRSTGWVIAI